MSAKTSAARREAFFTALAETGNQTISAERACVSRSWVTLHRSTDPVFKTRMEACVAKARVRLSGVAEQKPGCDDWQEIGGEELVVRGSGGRGGGRRVQVARARLEQWTPRIEARFLRELAASCNVKWSCKVVGLSPASAYVRRATWKGFADRWEEALAIGYMRLEMALIENGSNLLDGVEVDPDGPFPPMTVDQVIQFIGLHRRQVKREGYGVHRRYKPVDVEAVKREIVRKAKIMTRAQEMESGPWPDFMAEEN